MPSGVHSFDLKPGDRMNASLNWATSDNLDIYLDRRSSVFPGDNVQQGNTANKPEVMASY